MRMIVLPLLLVLPFLPASAQSTSKFPLGKDTTFVTGPLDKDGYIDYEAALNEWMRKGVTPENNANVLLWKAYGPDMGDGKGMPAEFFQQMKIDQPPKGGDYFIEYATFLKVHRKLDEDQIEGLKEQVGLATDHPRTDKDYPLVAAWLKANEKPLALAVEASRRPKYFHALVSPLDKGARSLIDAVGSSHGVGRKPRHLLIALTARAMLKVGKGENEEAWKDLLACHRLARLVSHGATLIELLVGSAVEQITANSDLAYLNCAKLTKNQIQHNLNDLRGLPPMPLAADKFNVCERFIFLDLMQHIRRRGIGALADLTGAGDIEKPTAEESNALQSIDWAIALARGNRWYTHASVALRLNERAEREKAIGNIEDDLKALKTDLTRPALLAKLMALRKTLLSEKNAKRTGEAVADTVLGIAEPGIRKLQDAADRRAQIERNLHLAFALAAYRADHGRYPANLKNLAPQYLAQVPDDLFSAKPLIYRASNTGYLLYSIGKNGLDDGGRGYDDGGDDLSVRMPLPELKAR